MKAEDAWGVPGARMDEIKIPAGKKYEAHLTDEEMAVVDAMRMGASVHLLLVTHSLEKVDEYLESFDGLKPDREYIHDSSDFTYPNVGFAKYYDQINLVVQATVMLEGGGNNE